MKTIDLDTLATISGGRTAQPLDLSTPTLGSTAGSTLGGPTIFNPSIRDIIGGTPWPTNPFPRNTSGR